MEAGKGWKPEKGGRYYHHNDFGQLDVKVWIGDSLEKYRYYQRNCFQTEGEAQSELDRLKAVSNMRDWLEEANDGWEPEFDWDYKRYYFIVHVPTKKVSVQASSSQYQDKPKWKHGKSHSIMQEMLYHFGEENIIKFIEA